MGRNVKKCPSCQAFLTGVTFYFFVWGFALAEPKSLTLIENIEKAWQGRQDRVRTARFSWKEKRTWPKGSISSTFGSELELRVPAVKGKIMPGTDKTVDFSYFLCIDNDKVRFEYKGLEWAMAQQDFRKVKYSSVFDGKTAKDLYSEGVGRANWPQGAIRKGSDYRDAGLAALRPLLLVYRPFAPKLQPCNILVMTSQGQEGTVEGRPCVALVQRLARNSSVHFWVDPKQEFTLARQLIIEQGVAREQIDIRYKSDALAGWIPTSWKVISQNHKGEPLYSITAVVTSVQFNIAVARTSFDLEFPPGTLVLDERNMENYLLRLDGTKRPILSQEENGATYEQILNSAPGEALGQKHFLKPRWELAIFIVLSLLVLSVFIWHRVRLRKLP